MLSSTQCCPSTSRVNLIVFAYWSGLNMFTTHTTLSQLFSQLFQASATMTEPEVDIVRDPQMKNICRHKNQLLEKIHFRCLQKWFRKHFFHWRTGFNGHPSCVFEQLILSVHNPQSCADSAEQNSWSDTIHLLQHIRSDLNAASLGNTNP